MTAVFGEGFCEIKNWGVLMILDFSYNVSMAMNGDTDAFAELYSLVYKDLYYIALCNLRNKADAEDAVSEAVLDAFLSIKKLRDEKAFSAWIKKILTVKIKKKQSENIKDKNTLTPITDDESLSTVAEFDEIEFIEQLDSLSENEKLVFSFSVICGYKSDEISKLTGLKSSTVRSHLARGREKLKKEICTY